MCTSDWTCLAHVSGCGFNFIHATSLIISFLIVPPIKRTPVTLISIALDMSVWDVVLAATRTQNPDATNVSGSAVPSTFSETHASYVHAILCTVILSHVNNIDLTVITRRRVRTIAWVCCLRAYRQPLRGSELKKSFAVTFSLRKVSPYWTFPNTTEYERQGFESDRNPIAQTWPIWAQLTEQQVTEFASRVKLIIR